MDPNRPTDTTLADLVTSRPSAARILERHGLDYCCGGRSTLSAACAEAGEDADAVLAEIVALAPEAAPDWAGMGPAALVDHVVDVHHSYLHAEMPRLSQLVDKVVGVHGERHPELRAIQGTYEELRAELTPHLFKEERVLFPAVKELAGATTMPWFPFGPTSGPVSMLLVEHDRAGALLERLRALTGDYGAPEDACGSFRALYAGLEELEADTHLHVHKENNVLFPAVAALESALAHAGARAVARPG